MLKCKLFEAVLFFYATDVLSMFFSVLDSGKFCVIQEVGEGEGKETIHAFQKSSQIFSGSFSCQKINPLNYLQSITHVILIGYYIIV